MLKRWPLQVAVVQTVSLRGLSTVVVQGGSASSFYCALCLVSWSYCVGSMPVRRPLQVTVVRPASPHHMYSLGLMRKGILPVAAVDGCGSDGLPAPLGFHWGQ